MQKTLSICFQTNKRIKAQELLNEMIVKIMEAYKVKDQLILTYVNEENSTVSIDTQEKYMKFLQGQIPKITVTIRESGIIVKFKDLRHEFEKKQSFQELINQVSQKFKIQNWDKHDLAHKNEEEIYIILNEEIFNSLINKPQLSLEIIEYLLIKKEQLMKKIKKVEDFQEILASIKMTFAEIKQFKLQYIFDDEYQDLDNQEDFDMYLEDSEQNPIILTNLLEEKQNLTIKINDDVFKITRKEQYDELKIEIANELKISGEYTLKFFGGDEDFEISNQEEFEDYLREFLSQSPIILIPIQVEKPILITKANEKIANIPTQQPLSQRTKFEVLNEKPNPEFLVQKSSSNSYAKPTEQIISIKDQQNQNQNQDQDYSTERQAGLPQVQKILFENLSEEQKQLFDLLSKQYKENNNLPELKVEIEALNQIEMELLIKYFMQEYKELNFNNNREIMNIEKQLQAYNQWLSQNSQYSLTKKVSIKNFEEFQKEFNEKSDQKDLYQHCQVHLDRRLALGQDFKSFFQLPIFVQQQNHPLYGYDDYKMLVFFCEKLPEKSIRVFYLYNKIPGMPLPFIFNSPMTKKLTMPLSSFSEILGNSNEKNLISLGPQLCGKSKLLNLLFKSKFHENLDVNKYPEHYGVQAIFNSEEYQMGFNIFDFQMNFANNDSSQEQREQIGNILKIFSTTNTKLLLHSKSAQDLKANLDYLQKLGWENGSISILIRDSKQITILYKQFDLETQQNMTTISKIENNNQFEAELNSLRIKIVEWVQTFQVQQIQNQNKYQDYESRAREIIKQQYYQISLLDHERINFSNAIRAEFKTIDVNKNIHQQLFNVCHLQHILNKIDKELEDTQLLDDIDERDQKFSQLTKEKKENDIKLKNVGLHNFVYVFDKIIRSKQLWQINIFSKELAIWSQPIIDPLLTQRKKLISQKDSFDEAISKHQSASNLLKSVTDENQKKALEKDIKTDQEIKQYKQKINQLEIDIRQNSQTIDSLAVSKEHFFRELNASYDLVLAKSHTFEQLNREEYLDSFVEFIRQGMEIEFIDGENNKFHGQTIEEIFKRLEIKYQEIKPFVISIIGPQSTGKSTLLNFLFNTSFQMSAGRCTKGMYASQFETDCLKAQRVIVLDTEGLLSIEKNDPAYDKKVTAFNMALSQILLINIMGDFNQAMKEILQMSLLTGQQLKTSLNKRPILIFVLRNCIDDNVDKMREIIDKIGQELKKVAKATNVELHDIVDYRGDQSFCLMYSAFNKDDQVQNGKKLYSICLVNDSFRNRSQWLLEKIFKEAENEQLDRSQDLKEFIKKSSEVWQALGSYHSLLSLKSIQEMNVRQELQKIVNEIQNQYIDINAKSDVKTLQKSLNEIDKQQDLFNSNQKADQTLLEGLQSEYQIKVKAEFEHKTKNQYEVELRNEYENQLIRIVKLRIQRVSDKLERNSAFQAIINKGKDQKEKVDNIFQIFLKENGSKLQNANQEEKEQLKNEYIKKFNEVLNGLITDFEEQILKLKQSKTYFATYTVKFLRQIIAAEEMATKTFLNYDHVENAAKNNQNHDDIKLFEEKIDEKDFKKILNELRLATDYNYNYFYCQVLSFKTMNREERNHQQIQKSNKIEKQIGFWDKIQNFFNIRSDKNQKQMKKYNPQFTQQGAWDYYQVNYQYQVTKADVEVAVDQVLIAKGFSAFFEIQTKIFESIQLIKSRTSIDTSFIQSLLREYEETIIQSEKDFLRADKVIFKKGIFEQKIAKLLFNCILAFYENEQEDQIAKQKNEFKEEMLKLKELMKKKLESFLGDQKIMVLIGGQIFETFTTIQKNQAQNKQIDYIQAKSKLQPSQLQALGDQLITTENVNKNKISEKEFQDWATNITDYLSQVYEKSFETTTTEAKKIIYEEAKRNLETQFKQLIDRLTKIQQAVSDLFQFFTDPGDTNSSQLGKIQFRLFLAMLTQYDKIKVILMELNSDFKTNIGDEQMNLITMLCENNQYQSQNLFQNPSILDDCSIQNLSTFLISLIDYFNQILKVQQIQKGGMHQENKTQIISWLDANVNVIFNQKKIDEIKSQNKQEAIGCREVCPYCGAKCTVPVIGGQNHDGNHLTNYHRVMGLRGTHQQDSNTKALKLITFCCTTSLAQQSIWKDSPLQEAQTSKQSLDANIRQMISEGAKGELLKQKCTMGELNFTISWSDPNDLDIFVTCPCGSKIGLGGCCSKCKGKSDLDMNYSIKHDANTPTEHVFYPKAEEGKYIIYVRMYQANKTYDGKTGGATSKFKLEIHKPGGESYLLKEFTVGGNVQSVTEIFDFFPSLQPLSFQDHLKKHYKKWTIIEGQQISTEAISLQGNLIQKEKWKQIILKQTKLTQ